MPRQRRCQEALTIINSTLDGLIAECQRLVDSGEEEFVDEFLSDKDPSILHFLLAAGDTLDSKQLRDDLMTLLIAGHETTAAVLTWTVYCLISRPEYALKVAREVDEVLGVSSFFSSFLSGSRSEEIKKRASFFYFFFLLLFRCPLSSSSLHFWMKSGHSVHAKQQSEGALIPINSTKRGLLIWTKERGRKKTDNRKIEKKNSLSFYFPQLELPLNNSTNRTAPRRSTTCPSCGGRRASSTRR